jgi:hypothetical protein
MHPLPTAMTEKLAQARVADFRRPRRARRQRPSKPIHRGTREATGWFLVGVGLRLAVPRTPQTA